MIFTQHNPPKGPKKDHGDKWWQMKILKKYSTKNSNKWILAKKGQFWILWHYWAYNLGLIFRIFFVLWWALKRAKDLKIKKLSEPIMLTLARSVSSCILVKTLSKTSFQLLTILEVLFYLTHTSLDPFLFPNWQRANNCKTVRQQSEINSSPYFRQKPKEKKKRADIKKCCYLNKYLF